MANSDGTLTLFNRYLLWLMKVVTLFVVFVIGLPLFFVILIAGLRGADMSDQELSLKGNLVAVVELKGPIEDAKSVVSELYKAAYNDKIRGIVLKIDSPGGAVGPSQEIYEAVKKLKARKPIMAVMGSVAASGGFYSALGATKVFVQSGTQTGSIGVIMQLPNYSKIAEKVQVDFVTIKTGKFKDVGNPFRDMTPEDKAFLQDTADSILEDFVQAVADGRSLDKDFIHTFADGRVILGKDAIKLKLADAYGDVYDAAREIFEIIGEPLDDDKLPQLYYPEDKFDKLWRLLDAVAELPMTLGAPTVTPSLKLRLEMLSGVN